MYQTILVPLDGSEVASSVLEQVSILAKCFRSRVLLLTVGFSAPSGVADTDNLQLSLTFKAEAYLKRVCTYLQAQGLETYTTVCVGEPACEIIEAVKRQQVDLIIINSRGGGGTRPPFLGSVAEKIIGASSVPVLVLHAPAEETR